MGHAVRCRELSSQFDAERVFCVNKNKNSIAFCEELDCKYIFEDDLNDFLNLHKPAAIISDINYIDEKFIATYRRNDVPIVCLAPRGSFKYQANLAFCDCENINEYHRAHEIQNDLRIGFDYAFIRSDIASLRRRNNCIKKKNQIVISMGGTDTFDAITKIVRYLKHLPDYFSVKVVLGKFYERPQYIRQLCEEFLSCDYEVLVSPTKFPTLLAESTFGIFGTGLVTYEAMCLGVIPFNVSISDFHQIKATLIQDEGAGFYVGDLRDPGANLKFIEKIQEIYDSKILENIIRKKAMQLIDGKSQKRIVNLIKSEILKP